MKYKYSFEEKKKYIAVAAACVLIVIAGIVYVCNRSTEPVDDTIIYAEAAPEPENDTPSVTADVPADNAEGQGEVSGNIYVHVCGAVKNPGIYELSDMSRIADAVDAAGGFTDKASENYLNLATIVSDGQKIVVPTKSEVKKEGMKDTGISDDMNASVDNPAGKSDDSGNNTLININTAGIEELTTIPGVGEAKAKSIIEYRQKNGNFSCKEDIMNITGIKEGVFSKISDYIVVN